MLTIKRPLPLFLLLAPLAACGTNRGMESVHQPVVQRSDYAIDVATSGGGLAPGEAQRLAGWMEAMRLGYGDAIALDDPNIGPGGSVHDDVQAVAAQYGLLVGRDAPVTNAPVAPGTVRIVVSRTRATVPGCPDHTRMNDPDFDAHTGSNYGCATNTNLAAMVANPADLVRGRPGAPDYDGQTAARAIGTLRAAKPTGDGGGWLKGKAESAGGK